MSVTSIPFVFWLAAFAGVGLLLAMRDGAAFRAVPVALVVIHPVATLCLFCSLAIHMHRSLGGWPRSIGDEGFPLALSVHADVALVVFATLIVTCALAWPAAVLLCAAIPVLRPGLRYVGLYAIASAATFEAMMFAPEPFLYWWRD